MLSPAAALSQPIGAPPGVLDRNQACPATQTSRVPVDLDGDQVALASQTQDVSVDLDRGQARSVTHIGRAPADLNGGQDQGEAQSETVTESEGVGQTRSDPQPCGADPSDALLLILADSLNDVENLRKATANQLRSLTREADGKGGRGLSPHSKAAWMLADRLAVLEQFERQTVLELNRAMRAHSLGSWVKRTVGIGEKQGARLIAAIGDPYWNHAEDRPRRGPAELWAYCGYAPDQKRRKGIKSNWNAEAKMRAYLCAESCMKQRTSPYRAAYDKARENWSDRETSDGHKHAHALRVVAKEILKDLWSEARASASASPTEAPPALLAEEHVPKRKAA